MPRPHLIAIKPESLGVELSISVFLFCFFLSFPGDSVMQQSLRSIALDQCCPVELSPVMEMLYICAVQYGSH